jgi:hypothetical protein
MVATSCCFPWGIGIMPSRLHISSLIPGGLITERVAEAAA